MKLFLFLIFTRVLSCSLSAQKKSFYITGGSAVLVNGYSANYERNIIRNEEGKFELNLKGRIGKVLVLDVGNGGSDPRDYISVSSVLLFGKTGKFMELELGYAAKMNPTRYFEPQFSFGYRLVKKYFLFRVGISYPEALYVSFGLPF